MTPETILQNVLAEWGAKAEGGAGRRLSGRVTMHMIERLEAEGRAAEAAALLPLLSHETRPRNAAERARAEVSRAAFPDREFQVARYQFLQDKVKRERRGPRERRNAEGAGEVAELSISVPGAVRAALRVQGDELGFAGNAGAALILGTLSRLTAGQLLAVLATARAQHPERFSAVA